MLSALFALLYHMYKDVAMAYTDLVYAQWFMHRWAIVTEKELFVHEKSVYKHYVLWGSHEESDEYVCFFILSKRKKVNM